MADSSFDIVSKIDRQEVDNALGQTAREIATRFDFKGTGASIEWQGEHAIEISASADDRATAVLDVFKGKLVKFKDGAPTEAQGELTLHGVTKPVTLTINSFKCMAHPMKKKEFCGADASGTINRDDFGVGWGKAFGFRMDVKLQIQVEAFAAG